MAHKVTPESFLDDVKNHQMQVLLDNGVYRHLRFKEPGNNEMYYDLITAPELLLYRGDMGCFEFERLTDMFDFFRTKELKINLSHWSEKLQAGQAKEFSIELFRYQVNNAVNDFINSGEIADDSAEFKDEIEDLLCLDYESDDLAHDAIRSFEFGTENIHGENVTCEDIFGQDTWEWNFEDFTPRFVWACYAIAWGVQQYDLSKG